MTAKRWTPADLSLAEQARAAGLPANIIAQANPSYRNQRLEEQEQMWFVEWCQAQIIVLADHDGDRFELRLDTALIGYPGGAYLSGDARRRAMHWSILKKMGCKAGVSDLVLNVPANGYHGMHIEMKKRRDQFKSSSAAANAVTAEQTAYLTLMRRLGYFTGVAFGWVEAAQKTCTYFGWVAAEHGV